MFFAESVKSGDTTVSGMGRKESKHFWQYNVQAKGPKGQKVNITQYLDDPHILPQPSDPVFSNMCSVEGIKHRYVNKILIQVKISFFF